MSTSGNLTKTPQDHHMKKAVVLLSGGLDSTTCLAIGKSQGFECHAISFNYGQKNVSELESAKRYVKLFGINHKIIDLPPAHFQGSSLTESDQAVPEFTGSKEIPTTYVPARNTIFLAYALGWAEVLGAQDIFLGANATDFYGYPDCRPEYIQAFQKLANLATKAGVTEGNIRIQTPLGLLSKAETIKLGLELGIDYQLTVTCYQADPQGRACGKCDSCTYRKNGFAEAAVADPTIYCS
jgi:7-cyano-7-deazaguanine synthase